jgi:hypothetical protein
MGLEKIISYERKLDRMLHTVIRDRRITFMHLFDAFVQGLVNVVGPDVFVGHNLL